MKLIPNWQRKNLRCHFCGETRSVKYSKTIFNPVLDSKPTEVCVCNKCALQALALIRELTDECKKWQSCLEIECEYTKADTVRKMSERVKQAICDNTYPDFNKDGKPVNVWSAVNGYDAIDKIVEEMLNERIDT